MLPAIIVHRLMLRLLCCWLTAVVALVCAAPADAMPANPRPRSFTQPDGTVVTISLRGDEFVRWHEDAQRYPVLRETGGRWVYAEWEGPARGGRWRATPHAVGAANPAALGLQRADPAIISERQAAARAARLTRPAPSGGPRRAPMVGSPQRTPSVPIAGTKKNLVVLVEFSDLAFTFTSADFAALFNDTGYSVDGAAGSVREYFKEVSNDTLNITSTVSAVVTLTNPYAYYGGNDGAGDDLRPQQMVEEALAALELSGFNFAQCDGNGDGIVDALTVVHAGRGEELSGNDANYIWSHAWEITDTVTYDGVDLMAYNTIPEMRGYDGDPDGINRIGVIVHELSHALCLMPDLYDYTYTSEGLGLFCLMAGGGWNGDNGTTPAYLSAWCREQLRWVKTNPATAGTYTVVQAEGNYDNALYKVRGNWSDPLEYFLIENRQGVSYDAGLPGPNRGLLIYHVDDNQDSNDSKNHYQVDLEEPGATQHLATNANSGTDADYWRVGTMTAFTDVTAPNSRSYANVPLGVDITNISATGASMTFTIPSTDTRVTAVCQDTAWYGAWYGRDTLPVLSLRVSNSASIPDTLTSITVTSASPYTIDTRSLAVLRLWADADTLGQLNSADTFIAEFTPSGIGRWTASGLAWAFSGSTLLVTACATETPVLGDSLMLSVPLYGLLSARAESGPVTAAATNGAFQFTSRRSVLLSEVENRGALGANDEFIELYNPTSQRVQLNGWKLLYTAAATNAYTGGTTKVTFSAADSIPAHGFFLCGASAGYSGDTLVSPNRTFTAGLADAGHIILRQGNGVIVDLLGYGSTAQYAEGRLPVPDNLTVSDSRTFERKAFDTSTAATMAGSDALAGNGADTDRNAADFVVGAAGPQNARSAVEPWLPYSEPLAVAAARVLTSATKLPGTNNVLVHALNISGAPEGDTLVHFALQNLGTARSDTDVSAVKLWQDMDADALWDATDSFVAALSLSGSTWYHVTLPPADTAALDTDGRCYLVTIDIAGGATTSSTFRAEIDGMSCAGFWADSGPLVKVTSACTITINAVIDSYTLSGTIPVEGTLEDSGTLVWLYDGFGVVDSTYVGTADGRFAFTGVLPGTYYLFIEGPDQTLDIRINGISVGSSNVELGTVPAVPAGDVIIDGRINILDAAYVRSRLGSTDTRADLNHDGIVNAADLVYLYSNFGRRHATP